MEDKEELAEWQEAFRLFDKDGDGRINEGELGQLLHSLSQDASDGTQLALINRPLAFVILFGGSGSINNLSHRFNLFAFLTLSPTKCISLWEGKMICRCPTLYPSCK